MIRPTLQCPAFEGYAGAAGADHIPPVEVYCNPKSEYETTMNPMSCGKSRPLLFLLFLFPAMPTSLYAQTLKGQWSGSFVTKGDVWGGKTEYVMELDMKGSQVDGYSYTYFVISGKRHYVICRLSGTYDKGSRSISVTEVEKVKSNTPADFKDMFQTHRLTYLKQGDMESLEGRWASATPGDAQTGETRLERRMLARVDGPPASTQQSLAANRTAPVKSNGGDIARTLPNRPRTNTQQPPTVRGSTTPPVASVAKPPQAAIANRDKPTEPVAPDRRSEPAVTRPATIGATDVQPVTPVAAPRVELRSNKLLQIIEVDQTEFTVELYDNGSVDGDTVSLFFNNRLMVSHKKLSTTPIMLELSLDRSKKDNELVMFAESLGEIPPNTALMVVKVRDKRYEVNITSTEQTNGSVRFRLKE